MEPSAARKKPVPWVGIIVFLAIVLLIVAFGLFKRKGSRKPPPIPESDTVTMVNPAHFG